MILLKYVASADNTRTTLVTTLTISQLDYIVRTKSCSQGGTLPVNLSHVTVPATFGGYRPRNVFVRKPEEKEEIIYKILLILKLKWRMQCLKGANLPTDIVK